jgi:signal transduction histidine kinase
VAIGVAVLKYRLYEIDVVISKAVLYGSLAVFITAVYAGLVVGVGTLAGGRDSPLLAALAAAVVAVAFQPARQWAGRLANRVVYGRRATPYQVLSQFAQRIGGAYADEEVLPQMAHIVAEGTGAERVVVWLRVDDELRPGASSGVGPDAAPLPVDSQAMPPLPDTDMSVSVVHQGDQLGAISVRMPRGEPLRPAGQQLVADVASQAGLVLSNVGLVEDLRASRQRLVTAQDEARRRLERNIHDGAQQDLVALAIKLRLAATTVDDDPARQILGELQTDAAGALQNLRDLARGIYPPLLADLGLAAALSAKASKSALPVAVEAGGIGRFPQDTEAALYFCCLEALQNTARYAQASEARICLQAENGNLRFTVSDDGTGYDTRHTPMGSGLRNMADWLAALGGQLEVRSAPARAPPSPRTCPSPSPAAIISAAVTDGARRNQDRRQRWPAQAATLLPHTHAQAAQTAAGQPEIKSQTPADIGGRAPDLCVTAAVGVASAAALIGGTARQERVPGPFTHRKRKRPAMPRRADSALKVRPGATVMHGAHISRSGAKPSQLKPGFYHRVGVRSGAGLWPAGLGRRPVNLRTKGS